MKYYSGNGDKGETGIADKKVMKNSREIVLVGALDELNAFLGYAAAKTKHDDIRDLLKKAEERIYVISAYSTGYSSLVEKKEEDITGKDVEELEKAMYTLSKETEDIAKFIRPNGSEAATAINICRTLARKAEREAVGSAVKNKEILAYLNRLSSMLFVLFRVENKRDGFSEEFF